MRVSINKLIDYANYSVGISLFNVLSPLRTQFLLLTSFLLLCSIEFLKSTLSSCLTPLSVSLTPLSVCCSLFNLDIIDVLSLSVLISALKGNNSLNSLRDPLNSVTDLRK